MFNNKVPIDILETMIMILFLIFEEIYHHKLCKSSNHVMMFLVPYLEAVERGQLTSAYLA